MCLPQVALQSSGASFPFPALSPLFPRFSPSPALFLFLLLLIQVHYVAQTVLNLEIPLLCYASTSTSGVLGLQVGTTSGSRIHSKDHTQFSKFETLKFLEGSNYIFQSLLTIEMLIGKCYFGILISWI
jgi:hypothetical protein